MTEHGSLVLTEMDPMVVVACDKCGRSGRYHRDELIERFGADERAPDMLTAIAQEAGCQRATGNPFSDRCGIHYLGPRMPKAR